MKRAAIWVGGLVVLGSLIFFGWGWWLYRTGSALAAAVLRPGTSDVPKMIHTFQTGFKPAGVIIRMLPETETGLQLKAVAELVERLEMLLGATEPREYIVLLQNNMEIRPTGGFMGSYATVNFAKGELQQIKIEDIYTPDGQVKGYVPEPTAIRAYLFDQEHPGWRLRDANWHPDFVESAKAIEWFFNEGEVKSPNGFAAVTLNPLVDLLQTSGDLRLADYGGLTINADNFYAQAQNHAETDFFPGSTQKRDFLGSVAKQMLFAIMENPKMAPSVAESLITALIHKELLIYIPDVTGASWKQLGWDGSLRQTQGDYLMINEANVGITKANCCIRRRAADVIRATPGGMEHQLQLSYANDNPATPIPPHFWGGGYKNYLRIIVPKEATLTKVLIDDTQLTADQIETEDFANHRAFGFLSQVEGGGQSTIKITYQVPQSSEEYSLLFQKQTGIDVWPLEITIDNRAFKKNVDKDVMLK